MRVLIVDDATFMRIALRKILEGAGHEVIGEAVDGKDAVKKYAELKPKLVTMDITMPEVDGIAATRAIRTLDPQAKILIISAMGQEHMVQEAILAGAYDFVVKPIDEKRLLQAVAMAQGVGEGW